MNGGEIGLARSCERASRKGTKDGYPLSCQKSPTGKMCLEMCAEQRSY